MRRSLFLIFLFSAFTACMKGQKVDLVIHNAKIHTMDADDAVAEAIAIRGGKIIEVGPERQILNKYRSDETIDAQGKEIYPGFTDAHGHMSICEGFALNKNSFTAASNTKRSIPICHF